MILFKRGPCKYVICAILSGYMMQRLNEINDAKQNVIADLNEKIKQETKKQENDM